MTFSCSGTIILTANIAIVADTTIDGSGQTVTISGNNAVRVFYVEPGITFKLNRLTVADGWASDGGGILNDGGTVTVSNSVFSGNSVQGMDDGGEGGAIYNNGTVTVNNSAFTGNSAQVPTSIMATQ